MATWRRLCVVFFPFWFWGGMWDLIALISDHFLFTYLSRTIQYHGIHKVITLISLRQAACLVVNPIKVNSFAYLFNCTTEGRTSD